MKGVPLIIFAGYLTLEGLQAMHDKFTVDFPKVKREAFHKQLHHSWKVLYNDGKDTPPGNTSLIRLLKNRATVNS